MQRLNKVSQPEYETSPFHNSPAQFFLKLYPKQKKSPTRLEEKMTWGNKTVDYHKPTWAFYKLVVDQARKLHGETITPAEHPLYDSIKKVNNNLGIGLDDSKR